jgi:hypothetical protein
VVVIVVWLFSCLTFSIYFFLSAGFPPQPCGGLDTLADWLSRDDIRKALHFDTVNPVHFNYDTSGPASITLWPFLATKLRVLIYNGDADDCVPYHGNEEWTTYLASNGQLTEETSWHPWYLNEKKKTIPQGLRDDVHCSRFNQGFQFYYDPFGRSHGAGVSQ